MQKDEKIHISQAFIFVPDKPCVSGIKSSECVHEAVTVETVCVDNVNILQQLSDFKFFVTCNVLFVALVLFAPLRGFKTIVDTSLACIINSALQ